MYTDDLAYAKARLTNTLVRLNGAPFIVSEINEDDRGKFQVEGHLMRARDKIEGRTVEITRLDIDSPLLGYVNSHGTAIFVMRKPARRWKQGVCFENLQTMGRRRLNGLTDLYEPVTNTYPSFKAATEGVNAIGGEVAFHRYWARSQKDLFYKGRPVGTILPDGFRLDAKYNHLKEALEEIDARL